MTESISKSRGLGFWSNETMLDTSKSWDSDVRSYWRNDSTDLCPVRCLIYFSETPA